MAYPPNLVPPPVASPVEKIVKTKEEVLNTPILPNSLGPLEAVQGGLPTVSQGPGQPQAQIPVFNPTPMNMPPMGGKQSLNQMLTTPVRSDVLDGQGREVVGDSIAAKALQRLSENAGLNFDELGTDTRLENSSIDLLARAAEDREVALQSGGLIALAEGGEFAGRVPGTGHGMEDNVRMPIKEGSKQVAELAVSPSEYVVDSHTMAALGNGNADRGADVMDETVKQIRQKAYGSKEQPKEISGLAALKPLTERV